VTLKKKSKAAPPSPKKIPFSFIFDLLYPTEYRTRPMFGCTAIYAHGRIVVILREKDKSRKDNGVWLATTTEHHASLAKEFPSMRSISLFESRGPTGWQNLPAESDDFEESVTRVCQLIKKNDPRLGKIPKPKKSSGKKSRK
jgi:hypothetical protein